MKTSIRTEPRRRPAKSRPSKAPERKLSRTVAIDTILVPVDFSAPSLKALTYACPLAEQFDAHLHLVHVNDLAAEAPVLIPVLGLDPGFEPKVRRQLQTIAEKCDRPITTAHCHVRIGKAYDQICREARKLMADLIVISTHGYTGLKHMLIGSTAERVVRHAPCPVLVVREDEREFVGPGKTPDGEPVLNIKRILVPVDFSERSRAAVRYAVGWAKRFGASLTLVHSVYPHYYATNSDYSALDYPELLERCREAAEGDMRKLTRQTSFGGVPFEGRIMTGFPGQQLPQFASQHGVDLIVTCTHGRTGLKHALIGSTAEQIVRFAKCPVLVLPGFNAQTRR